MMTKFVNPYENPEYLEQILFLYLRYSKFLDDDYAQNGLSAYEYFINLVAKTMPYFWIITEDNQVSGFVYLDNIIGNKKNFHSAELTTCFDKKFWGDYTKKCAKIFINYCFENFGFKKIKALVYPQNFRVKTLLKSAGFEKEALLRGETMKNNELQDIEIYSVKRNKNESGATNQ